MCTVIIEVPPERADPVRLLAVRDEDPARPWDPPGAWWEDRPGVIGVRDRRAGGAWLAAAPERGRLSVILNRADIFSRGLPAPSSGLASRGMLVLDSAGDRPLPRPPRTAGFNLISVAHGRATVSSWDGETLKRSRLEAGIHMIAHHDIDDRRSARIDTWLPAFRAAEGGGAGWRRRWIEVLERSTALPPGDDRAIIRDNRGHGYPTQSLLVCTAEVRGDDSGSARPAYVQLESAALARPATWDAPRFTTA